MRACSIAKRLLPTVIKTPTHTSIRAFGTRRFTPTISQVAQAVLLKKFDEQLVHNFNPAYWYPATIGHVLNDTYKIVAKLGSGSSSTVWLAKDITRWSWGSTRYVTLKILTSYANNPSNSGHHAHESYISSQIRSRNLSHPGFQFLRTAIDEFQLEGKNGSHSVLVYEPMRESMWEYLDRLQTTGRGRECEPWFVKTLIGFILSGLDYLHNECGIVHRDISLSNILLPLESSSLLAELEKSEARYPFPVNTLPCGYQVHMAHDDFGPIQPGKNIGPPKLHDFGTAIRLGEQSPFILANYVAPEVILECEDDFGADIWGIGMVTWQLLAGTRLLDGTDPDFGLRTQRKQLADITSLLGPPPRSLLSRGKASLSFFNSIGKFKYPKLLSEDLELKAEFLDKMSRDEQSAFLDFMKGIVTWDPKDRRTVRELMEHRWLVQ